MGKAASPVLLPSNSCVDADLFVSVNNGKKRTPSDLRGEQLKRRNTENFLDELPHPMANTLMDITGTGNELRRPDPSRNSRLIDTRMDGIFLSRKPNSRSWLQAKKENGKADKSKQFRNLKEQFIPPRVSSKFEGLLHACSEKPGTARGQAPETERKQNDERNAGSTGDDSEEASTQNKFIGVAELSIGSEKRQISSTMNMDIALRGLASQEPTDGSTKHDDAAATVTTSTTTATAVIDRKNNSEVIFNSEKIPLDLTLKTSVWILSSSSVNWVHRWMVCGGYNERSGTRRSETMKANPLQSWVHPQSSLPSSVISMMAVSSGEAESDFLAKRHAAWSDAFRSLYYMLRSGTCRFFYVCTQQFIVMFVRKSRPPYCCAYLTRSTGGLRSLLKEHDVEYSMPLCGSTVEEKVAAEDLVELSEIERHNLGQTRRTSSLRDVDNTKESLLALLGSRNVHGLYDLLLNYRSFFTMLSGFDVPVLCSAVPFENAGMSTPQVKCMETRKAVTSAACGGAEFTYSVHIKDVYIPPWVVCNLCTAMASDGRTFEASFMTENVSVGLNGGVVQGGCELGIPNASSPSMHVTSYMKGLDYANGAYSASLSSL